MLFTRPTWALKNHLNWKPTRMGANIMGIIIRVRGQALSADGPGHQLGDAQADQELEVDGQADEQHRAPERLPEQGVLEQQVDIVLQADKVDSCLAMIRCKVGEAQVERVEHRKADDQQDDEDAGQQQSQGQMPLG